MGVRAFTAMKNLLLELGYTSVFVFVDEFESIARLSSKDEQATRNSIRHLMDQNSEGRTAGVKKSIYKTIDKSDHQRRDGGYIAFSRSSSIEGVDEIKVRVDPNTGRMEVTHPKKGGKNVWTWSRGAGDWLRNL